MDIQELLKIPWSDTVLITNPGRMELVESDQVQNFAFFYIQYESHIENR
jgi:hypothetical protein